ncbi:WecB/TagA/CpsF family glycosyltransferase [Aliiglaciecola sp. M165]|uniref:WecB/TagA/CpsF family glycosyltransferase n=1 Tax=Aliiglaciecola sp. M165 TaxID=2593649 RepID=UPI0011800FE5|nr:WecB/TagA/CpsF family glycosyltransferase [Aliiglaciecola sp. M165]TRY32833.1 WecB/TagA/CpsF family glycosyltransferase [Aliiglaciecola sp. M165]
MKDLAQNIHVFDTSTQALDEIEAMAKNAGVNIVSFVNAHACNMSTKSPDFEHALLNSDLLLRDGIGTKILLKCFSRAAGANLNGTDLIPLILARLSNKRVVFIGTQEPYISESVEVCKNQNINVIGYMDGFGSNPTMLRFVEKHAPDIVILGMGMPKQELFAMYLKDNFQQDLLIVNGGAIFDFLAGRFNRAPAFFRDNGLEWFYRLINEPRRLFQRYVLGIPIFFIKVIYARFIQ